MNHQPRAVRSARLLSAAAAVAAVITIGACGSSAPNGSTAPSRTSSPTGASTSAATGSSSTSSTSSTLAFSNCMRSHGVPNFPDLASNGIKIEASGQTLSVNGVAVNAPAFVAARQKCRKYLPTQQTTPTEAAQQRQRGLEFAKCMRSHGVRNFPDPQTVSSHNGNQVARLPAVIFQSPAFKAAANACGGGPKGP
jgi:hypothetical protein